MRKKPKLDLEELQEKFHPLANIFPLLNDKELQKLANDIKENGQQETIKIYKGQILDGRNRSRACLIAGIKPKTEEYKGNNPAEYVVSLNMMRRHLNDSQRAMAAVKIATLKRGNRKASIEAFSQDEAAKMFKISRSAIQRAAHIEENGIPELKQAVNDGKITVAAAKRISNLKKDEQKKMVSLKKKEMLKTLNKSEQARKPKTHPISVEFTDKELNMITKAQKRHSADGSRASFLHDIILDYCAEAHLPPTKPQVKTMMKKKKVMDINYDEGMEDKG